MRYGNSDFEVDFPVKGEIIKKIVVSGLYIVITKESTINADIILLNIYVNKKRNRGVRVKEENLTFFYISDIINRVLFDEGKNSSIW